MLNWTQYYHQEDVVRLPVLMTAIYNNYDNLFYDNFANSHFASDMDVCMTAMTDASPAAINMIICITIQMPRFKKFFCDQIYT